MEAQGTKKNPLQPFKARIIHSAGEPSGITYCTSTGTLWIISDSNSRIYEADLEGNIITEWFFTSHHDVEAVTCDDANQLIYIAEEGKMTITSFVLPRTTDKSTYHVSSKKPFLKPVSSFYVDLQGIRSTKPDLPGLEGLTWVPSHDLFIAAVEKKPSLLLTISKEGDLKEAQKTNFSGDLSGVAYDDELDKLWVLSDKSERVFLTDITGKHIYDYWDLPVENPEGIVINNNVTPPTLYIVTDPSSPKGKQYIPGMFFFTKPTQGTGLRYYNGNDPSPAKVQCDGCEEVWKAADKVVNKEHKHGPSVTTIVLASVLPPVSLMLFFCSVIVLVKALIILKRKQKSRAEDFDVLIHEPEHQYSDDLEVVYDQYSQRSVLHRILSTMSKNCHIVRKECQREALLDDSPEV
eukprot:CAMPEP_0206186580 /NCGR_PEP_ID=MMETSP0166-20121206/2487_1 /ASSEMBLY_ACC=CAM_ASM_000260 /TAXON_ID=95228 /ORGANISM="Vannella robusta, Strain DIVA3 518/3/11/1/6" /LENGTH=406 /DNA_ID=CAMNT_0053601991 /DNA_START=95 /DNA_END=1315 /DNA_ORIENTATION=+